ncbi:MAG TPA: hypothetical protein VLL97_12210 [Acidobacteriota bacterium]|nr:hypothetical protein [Acidobacteriota bacterium]
MMRDRDRILELALESLENKKKELENEIVEITRELKNSGARRTPAPAKKAVTGSAPKANAGPTKRKRARFSKEEKARRSERLKEYWRKKKAGKA